MGKSVVVHFEKGHILKGTTADFHAKRPAFHVTTADGRVVVVPIGRLKAVFFVRDLAGDSQRHDTPGFGMGYGRQTTVAFRDGEVLEGLTEACARDAIGFFLVPGDPAGNNERVFCVNAAIADVIFT
jgi:hypothetical protein